MLIALSSTDFNPLGHVWIDASVESVRGEWSRRVSRQATLDGGVVLIDGGFSDGDRSLDLRWRPTTAAQIEKVRALMEDAATVYIALPEGFYSATIERVGTSPDEASARVLLLAKLSA